MSYKAPTPGRFDARQNTTDYVHPQETNLLAVERAMQYNGLGQPVLRTHVDGITLEGDVLVSDVTVESGNIWVDGITGNISGITTLPAITGNVHVYGNVDVDHMPNIGIIGNISGITTLPAITGNVGVSGNVSITQMPAVTGNVHIYGNIGGSDQPITVNQGTNPWTITGEVTVDQGDTFYGEPYSIPLIPIVQLNSYDGIRIRDAQTYSGLGGSVTEDETSINVSCSSTVGSYGVYRSRKFIPYNVGQSDIARIIAKFDTPATGTSQRIGIANQENGYFLGYNGLDFQFLHTYDGKAEVWELELTNVASATQTVTLTLNGTAYTINSIVKDDTTTTIAAKICSYISAHATNVWLCEQIDNKVVFLSGSLGNLTGTFSYSSTGNVTGTITVKVEGVAATNDWFNVTLPAGIDPKKYNNWQLQYAWDGVACYVQDPSSGRFKFFYRFEVPGTELPVAKPSFKVSTVCYNVGGSTGVTLYVAGLFGAIEGEQVITKLTSGGSNTQSSLNSGTYWHIMSIQNPYVHPTSHKLNFRTVEFLDLVASVQGNDPVSFYIYFDQPKAAGYNFNFTSVPDKVYQADLTDGIMDVSQDTPVMAIVVGINGTLQFNLIDYNLVLPPGSHMSLVAYSTSSINKVTMSGTWRTVG